MKVALKRINECYHFEAVGSDGSVIQMDASPQIGGEGKGTRPMELLLMSIGGCASIDVGLILKKQKQTLHNYELEVEGVRYEDDAKSLRAATLHFKLYGELDKAKVERAIDLTVKKYCSVLLSLNPSIEINTTYTILKS